MATHSNPLDTKILADAIEKGITTRAEEEFEKLKSTVIEKLELRKQEIVGGIAIEVMKLVEFQRAGDNIVITIVKRP